MCEDETTIGAPFYVMERIEGEVIVSSVPATLDTPAERRRIGEQLIDALVEIHAVDWRAAGLEGFGKPTGYLERQLRRFTGLWELNKTREIPAVESVGRWLAQHLPEDSLATSTIVHGDYRLGNTMYSPDAPARLTAVLDWEMATIGDPLADIGYLCMMWAQAGDPSDGLRAALGNVTRAEGFTTREELIARYEERSGRSMRRHPLVHHARAVEERGVHGGQLQARARRHHRRSLPGAVRRRRARARQPRRGGGTRWLSPPTRSSATPAPAC